MSRQQQYHGRRSHVGAAALMLLLATMATLFAGTAQAQRTDGSNEISYPNSDDLTIHYFDTVVVSFETDYPDPWMYIFCNRTDLGLLEEVRYYSPVDVRGKPNVTFDLTYDYMPTAPCWFNLRSAQRNSTDNNTEVGATSPSFSYIAEQGTNQTFSLAAAATTSSTTTPAATTTGAASSEGDSSDSGGLSGGAKAGIAIGVVAVVGLAGLAAWLLFDRRRRQKAMQNPAAELDSGSVGGGGPDSRAGGGPDAMSMTATAMTPSSARGSDNNNPFSPFAVSEYPTPPLPPPPPSHHLAGEKTRQHQQQQQQQQFHELSSEQDHRYELDAPYQTPASTYSPTTNGYPESPIRAF